MSADEHEREQECACVDGVWCSLHMGEQPRERSARMTSERDHALDIPPSIRTVRAMRNRRRVIE